MYGRGREEMEKQTKKMEKGGIKVRKQMQKEEQRGERRKR